MQRARWQRCEAWTTSEAGRPWLRTVIILATLIRFEEIPTDATKRCWVVPLLLSRAQTHWPGWTSNFGRGKLPDTGSPESQQPWRKVSTWRSVDILSVLESLTSIRCHVGQFQMNASPFWLNDSIPTVFATKTRKRRSIPKYAAFLRSERDRNVLDCLWSPIESLSHWIKWEGGLRKFSEMRYSSIGSL